MALPDRQAAVAVRAVEHVHPTLARWPAHGCVAVRSQQRLQGRAAGRQRRGGRGLAVLEIEYDDLAVSGGGGDEVGVSAVNGGA